MKTNQTKKKINQTTKQKLAIYKDIDTADAKQN